MVRRFSTGAVVRPVTHLAFEELEDRWVPSSYRWALARTTNNWNDASNWQAQAMPGGPWAAAATSTRCTPDAALFDGTSGRNVTLNVTSVGQMTITSGYTGTLALSANTTVYMQMLAMNGGVIQGRQTTRLLSICRMLPTR